MCLVCGNSTTYIFLKLCITSNKYYKLKDKKKSSNCLSERLLDYQLCTIAVFGFVKSKLLKTISCTYRSILD